MVQRNPGKGKKHKPIPEALIQARAYEIWKTRQREGKDGSPEKDWEQARAYLESERWEQVFIWAGFDGKRLWDWLKLLIVPGLLWYLSWQIQVSAKEREMQLAVDKTRQESLSKYLEQMNELLLNKKLREASPDSDIVIMANLATAITLRELDVKRQNLLLHFLSAANLYNPINNPNNNPKYKVALLKNIDLNSANLNSADLGYADLTKANLSEANLSRTKLGFAILNATKLTNANLSGAKLNSANLRNAILRNADLSQADLRNADLSQADLSQANFRNADLSQADLSQANLSDVSNLIDQQITSACYWNNAIYKKDKTDNENFIKQLEKSANDKTNSCNKLWNK
jgi:uncharacterized protein YjbI with pentapeptide repeats